MNTDKTTRINGIILTAIGCLALILCLVCFVADAGEFESMSRYGGDAYTGIQNASALAASNTKCVAQICSLGFGSILLVGGLLILAKGILLLMGLPKTAKNNVAQQNKDHSVEPSEKVDEEADALLLKTQTEESKGGIDVTKQDDAGLV